MYLSYQNIDVVGVWEEVTSLVGIELRHCPLFETSWNIDEVDRGQKMCPHYFIPEWNLFEYTMKDSRRFETIEMLNIHTNIHVLSEWFRINYLSKVFNNKNDLYFTISK